MARLGKYVLIFLLILCCLQGAAQSSDGANSSVERSRAMEYYYLQARSYFEQDSIDRSFELLQHCLALDPSSASVMYDLSSFYAYLKKDSITHAMLNKVVESDPSNSEYNKALVNYHLNAGDIDAAIGVFEKQLEIGSSKSDTYRYLYSLYAEAGSHEKAISMLEKLEKLDGSSEDITLQKLRQYMSLNDSAKAVDVVCALIDENPDDTRCWTLLGNTYSLLGDREKALEAFDKALQLSPDDDYALSSLTAVYINDEDDSLYCDALERLLKCEGLETEARLKALVQYIEYKHPDSVRLTGFLKEMTRLPFDEVEIAEVYAQYLVLVKADPDTIAAAYERVLELEPENVQAIIKLLVHAIDKNDADAVFKYADEAIPYLPDRLEFYYYKGISCQMQEREEDALEVYKQGLEKRGEDTEPGTVSAVYALMGDIYHEKNMMEECWQAYDSALVYDNSNISTLNNYAYFLSLEGRDLQRALDMSYKTIVAEPENVTYIDTYAWVLFSLGRYEEAKAYAEKLIAINEDMSAEVYSHCGDIYAKCGDIGNAVKYWTMARDAGDDSKLLQKKIKNRKYYNDAKRKK